MNRGRSFLALMTYAVLGCALCAAQGPAAEPPTAPTPEQPKITTTETIVVTAPGEFRDEQQLQTPDLIEEAPGTSPIKSLAMLPSVNYQAADPYGSYEWAVRISARGFNQNQLGFTLDDVPLGDMSYGNWNGLHISRAIADENLGSVLLSQGTGALETASNSNLGGTMQFISSDPADKRGFSASQAFGSFNAYRTFARYDSGLLGGNTKLYISGVYNMADKWRGQGEIGQGYWQLNGKLTHTLGNKGVLTAFLDVSDRREVDYQDVNMVWTQDLGYNWDNYGVWNTAVQAAYACATDYGYTGNTVYNYPYPVTNLGSTVAQRNATDACDAAYYAGSGQRRDVLGYVNAKLALTSKLTWKTTLYGHGNDGIGLWFMPTVEGGQGFYNLALGLTGSPIAMRSSEYGIQRGGLISSLAYETNRNKVELGGWFEKENFNLARRYYATSASSPLHTLRSFPTGPMYTQWAYNFDIDVYQIHAQDVYRATDKLTLAAGFKTIYTDDDGVTTAFDQGSYNGVSLNGLNGYTAANFAQGSLNAGKPFLPQFGINYKLDKQNEIFGDAAYNVRTYQAGGYGFGNAPWGAKSQAAFDTLKSTLKPETSWTEELGYRYTGHHASAQASYFHVNYFDRLLAYSNGSGIAGNPSTLNNVGSVVTNGVDGSVSIRLTPEWTLYNALTWNKSTYEDDPMLASGGCVFTTATGACDSIVGKLVVDTPEFLYKNSLEYAKHGFFGKIGSDYMSTRYFTYSNDGSVGGRFLAQFSTGYTREQLGAFKDLKAQFNVSNLADAKYYASIGTNGFIMHDPQSVNNNTLQVGAPRSVSGTLSVRF